MRDLRDVRLRLMNSTDDIMDFKRWLSERRSVLAFDSETTGLRWWRPDQRMRLFQFGDIDTGFAFRVDQFGALINEVFDNYRDSRYTGFNGWFDFHWLEKNHYSLPPMHLYDDAQMMSKILEVRGPYALKTLADRNIDPIASRGQQALKLALKAHGLKEDEKGWSSIPYEAKAYTVYSAMDTVITARLWEHYQKPLEQFRSVYDKRMASAWVTYRQTHRGLHVNVELAKKIRDEWELERAIILKEIQAYGIHNPNSKSQQITALMEKEDWNPESFTDSGKPRLDHAVMVGLEYPVVQLLVEYARLGKWIASYVNPVIEESVNGIVYPSINPFGAKTARQSASSPPVQQMPSKHSDAPKMREMFVAPEGMMIIGADYDAQENRLAIDVSGDKVLEDFVLNGKDIHRYVAAIAYGKPESEITKAERDSSKSTVYASAYGVGAHKMSQTLKCSVEEAQRILDSIDKAFPQLAKWKKANIQRAKDQYAQTGLCYATTYDGLQIHADKYEGFEPKAFRVNNYILQGNGAAMLAEVMNRLAAKDLDQYVYLTLHDEIKFLVEDSEEGYALARECVKLMQFDEGQFRVPITATIDEQGSKVWKK